MTAKDTKIDEFLAARGGPFYELQKRLHLLREDAFHAGRRAAMFVGVAWGVPLMIAGATQLPVKELLKVVKRLLLF